ncbi:hypothetical protein HSBAA_27960 [Vreelandella sulfidaeris]|uniref:Uncharacterized protein n=1 Tax=Vreelandella sulfidaeris TaxID=115553 RepID=A0A455U5R2_9GAMM|nr:hypothetical protein HSBAA_27960 [Halomonas sulfidaeris]
MVLESDPEESQGTLEEQGSGRLANDQRDRRSSTLGLDWLETRDKRENWSNRVGRGFAYASPSILTYVLPASVCGSLAKGLGSLSRTIAFLGLIMKGTLPERAGMLAVL